MTGTGTVAGGPAPGAAGGLGGRSYAQPSAGRSRAAVRGVLWSALHTAVPTVSAAVVFFVAARYLSPVDFGLVGLAASIVAFATALAPGAFGEALIQRRDVDQRHADSVFWLTLGVGIAFFLALVAAASAVAAWTGEPSLSLLLPFLALKVPFDLAATVPNALVVRSMQFRLIALRTTIATAVSVVLCLSLLVAGQGYWALAASQVAVSVVNCIVAFRVVEWRPAGGPAAGSLRELLSYSLFASGTRMLSMISLDQILVGMLAGAPVLGLYYFARRILTLLNSMIAGALSSVSHALLSSLQGEREKVREALLFASFASSIVSFPVFAGIALIAGDAVPLVFGAKWAGAVVPIRAFCAMGLIASIGIVQGALLTSQGKAGAWFWYQLLQQATTLAIIAALAHDLDRMVVAVAVKTVLLWPISVRMTTRLLDLRMMPYLREYAAPVAATLAMTVCVLAVPLLLPGLDPPTRLVAEIGVGVLIYLPAAALLGRARLVQLRRLVAAKGR